MPPAGCCNVLPTIHGIRNRWWSGSRTLSQDRKSTRLNSSHVRISYAVFCLKKKNKDTRGDDIFMPRTTSRGFIYTLRLTVKTADAEKPTPTLQSHSIIDLIALDDLQITSNS